MGQAKCRGTFDQRKAQAIAIAEIAAEQERLDIAAAEREQAEVLATLPPEQRKRVRQSSAAWKAVLGAALAASLTKR